MSFKFEIELENEQQASELALFCRAATLNVFKLVADDRNMAYRMMYACDHVLFSLQKSGVKPPPNHKVIF